MKKILLALALVPGLARPGDFVANPTNDLYPDKAQGVLCPFAVSNPAKCWTYQNAQAVKNALKDLRDHTAGWVNVKTHGVAPGASATVNGAALATALGGYSARTTLIFPSGSFDLPPETNLGLYKRIVCAGRDLTTLRFTMNAANGAALLADQYTTIEGCTIENVGTNHTTSIGVASWTPSTSNGWANGALRDSRVKGFGYGVGATAVSPATQLDSQSIAFNTTIANVEFVANGQDIRLGNACNNLHVTRSWFGPPGGGATLGNRHIWLNNCLGARIDHNSFEPLPTSTPVDIELGACAQASITDNYFEGASGIYAYASPGLRVAGAVLDSQQLATYLGAFVKADAPTTGQVVRASVSDVYLKGSSTAGTFAASAAAGSKAEVLTDNITSQDGAWAGEGVQAYPKFKEGTWTPTFYGSTGNGTITVTGALGHYVQRGKAVTATFSLIWTAAAVVPSGNLGISGLPGTISTRTALGANYWPSAALSKWGVVTLTGGYTQLGLEGQNGSSTMLFIQSGTGISGAVVPGAALGALGHVEGRIEYEIE